MKPILVNIKKILVGIVTKFCAIGATYQLVKDQFQCAYRRKIEAKNKGKVEMYFVGGIL